MILTYYPYSQNFKHFGSCLTCALLFLSLSFCPCISLLISVVLGLFLSFVCAQHLRLLNASVKHAHAYKYIKRRSFSTSSTIQFSLKRKKLEDYHGEIFFHLFFFFPRQKYNPFFFLHDGEHSVKKWHLIYVESLVLFMCFTR